MRVSKKNKNKTMLFNENVIDFFFSSLLCMRKEETILSADSE